MSSDERKKIALIDLDAYFCSAETLKEPSLKHIPFAVGGKTGRGVISTANYLARQYGVRSAMSSHKAFQLCPQLQIIAGDMPFYKQLSKQIYRLLCEYSDSVEQASIDEFYLDLTHNKLHSGSASLTVAEIRQRIEKLGVTASAGISPLRMISKIASEDNKPNGQTVIKPDQVLIYLKKLPLKRIPGVGPVTLQKLNNAGFEYGGDIQESDISMLSQVIGSRHAALLYERCKGIDPRGINTERQRKSIGMETTLEFNIEQFNDGKAVLKEKVLAGFYKRYRQAGSPTIKSQTVKLKFADFQITTVSQQSNRCSEQVFFKLLEQAWERREQRQIRLVGISVSLLLKECGTRQIALF